MATTNWERPYVSGYENITGAAKTLTSADHGKVYRVNVADCVFTLPSTEAGLVYHFVIDTLGGSTGCSLSPAAADNVNGGADNKDWINTAATDVIGDSITLIADGSEGWLTIGQHGIWVVES
jgi:hypothetical protein